MGVYRHNIGAVQTDTPNLGYIHNIGASQTDPASFEATDIIISGEGSLIVSDLTIKQNTEATIAGSGSFVVEPTASNIYDIGHILTLPLFPILPGTDVDANNGANRNWSMAGPMIMDGPLVGDQRQNTPIAADEQSWVGGSIIDGISVPWFEVAHLLPRIIQDMGNLVTEQTISCELYNADRRESITVVSITDHLGLGFTVIGVPTPPFNIASQDSLLFSIKVLQSGDLIIDGDYTLTLSTGETYTIYIIGSRIVLLPIRPEAPLREHIIWETKILTAVEGDEQRIANREYPRGEFEFTFKDGIRRVEMILFDRQSKLLAVPAWHEPSFMTSAGAIDDVTINVDETRYSNLYAGGYAVVFQDEYTFDALKIDSLTSTTITFESGLTAAFEKNTQVMPLLAAWAEPTTSIVKAAYNDQTTNVKLHVSAVNHNIASAAAFNIYNSKPFLDDPNYLPSGRLQEALRTKVYVLDNSTGDREQFSLWQRAVRNSAKGFKTNTRKELWEMRQLLHFLKGQQVSFYIPTFTKDLVPRSTLIISSSTFTMDNIGYTNNVGNRWPKKVFRLHLKDGTILTRTIQNSSEVSTAVEQLTVDVVWPYNIEPADIERVEFLTKVRFATDDIVIVHYNALGWAECVVPVVEVMDDDI